MVVLCVYINITSQHKEICRYNLKRHVDYSHTKVMEICRNDTSTIRIHRSWGLSESGESRPDSPDSRHRAARHWLSGSWVILAILKSVPFVPGNAGRTPFLKDKAELAQAPSPSPFLYFNDIFFGITKAMTNRTSGLNFQVAARAC